MMVWLKLACKKSKNGCESSSSNDLWDLELNQINPYFQQSNIFGGAMSEILMDAIGYKDNSKPEKVAKSSVLSVFRRSLKKVCELPLKKENLDIKTNVNKGSSLFEDLPHNFKIELRNNMPVCVPVFENIPTENGSSLFDDIYNNNTSMDGENHKQPVMTMVKANNEKKTDTAAGAKKIKPNNIFSHFSSMLSCVSLQEGENKDERLSDKKMTEKAQVEQQKGKNRFMRFLHAISRNLSRSSPC